MGNYEFNADLKVEEKTKQEIKEFLEASGWRVVDDNNDFRYDFILHKDDKLVHLELKEDFKCKETGNVAVEYYSRGKPSGLRTTQADFYLYKVHNPWAKEYIVVNVDKLKRFIKESFDYRTVTGGDKGSNTKMYLLTYEVFRKLGQTIRIMTD